MCRAYVLCIGFVSALQASKYARKTAGLSETPPTVVQPFRRTHASSCKTYYAGLSAHLGTQHV